MADLILTPTVTATFPSGAEYTLDGFATAFANRLSFTLSSSSIIFGQLGGSEPTSALPGNGSAPGVWIPGPGNAHPYYWDTTASKYLPGNPVFGQMVGGTLYRTVLACGSTQDTTLTSPNKSGTLAVLGDLGTLQGTQTTGGTSITVDWTLKKTAYVVLSGNTTFTQSGGVDGQTMDIYVENNATSYTATYSGVTWPNNAAPTQTTAAASHRSIDHVRLEKIGSTIFGRVLNNSSYTGAAVNYDLLTSVDTTPPIVSTLQGYSATIYVKFNELVQGGSLSTSGWTIKKAGNTQIVNSVSASGDTVSVVIASAFLVTDSITCQYSGSTVKDLAGNVAAVFGPSTVTMVSSVPT